MAAQLRERFPLKAVAITLRENPLVWKNNWTAIAYHDGQVLPHAHLRGRDRGPPRGRRLVRGRPDPRPARRRPAEGRSITAWRRARIKHSIPGDFAWVTRDEVEALLKGGGLRISR